MYDYKERKRMGDRKAVLKPRAAIPDIKIIDGVKKKLLWIIKPTSRMMNGNVNFSLT
jgi:hypothetical protein